jgi:membrane protease YdiL (CAAX protease family)
VSDFPRYRAHHALIDPARRTSQVWRLVVGLVLIVLVVMGLNSVLQAALLYLNAETTGLGEGKSPVSLLLLLGSFGFVIVAVAVTVRQIHHRSLISVIGPLPQALRDFWRVLRALLMLTALLWILPPWGGGEQLTPNLNFGLWISLLPLSLTVLLIQTSAEEILFRGYIQQQLAARFSHPAVWMVLPSALFALGHYLPGEAGQNAWMIALWTGIFGVLMADLTARAGTLGPAIALHFVNNLSSLLLISLPDSLSGLSLYTVPFDMADPEAMTTWLPIDFATMIVSWLVARLAIRR